MKPLTQKEIDREQFGDPVKPKPERQPQLDGPIARMERKTEPAWTKKRDWFGGRTNKPLGQMTLGDAAFVYGRLCLLGILLIGGMVALSWFVLWATD